MALSPTKPDPKPVPTTPDPIPAGVKTPASDPETIEQRVQNFQDSWGQLAPDITTTPQIAEPPNLTKIDDSADDPVGVILDQHVDPTQNLVNYTFWLFKGLGAPPSTRYQKPRGKYTDVLNDQAALAYNANQLSINLDFVGSTAQKHQEVVYKVTSAWDRMRSNNEFVQKNIEDLTTLHNNWDGYLGEIHEEVDAVSNRLNLYTVNRSAGNSTNALMHMQQIASFANKLFDQADGRHSPLNRIAKAISRSAKELGIDPASQTPTTQQNVTNQQNVTDRPNVTGPAFAQWLSNLSNSLQHVQPYYQANTDDGSNYSPNGYPGYTGQGIPQPGAGLRPGGQAPAAAAGNPQSPGPPEYGPDGADRGPGGRGGPGGGILNQILLASLLQKMAQQNQGDQQQPLRIQVYRHKEDIPADAKFIAGLNDSKDSLKEFNNNSKGVDKKAENDTDHDIKNAFKDAGLKLVSDGTSADQARPGSYVTWVDRARGDALQKGFLVECNDRLCVYRGDDDDDVFPFDAIGPNLKKIYHLEPRGGSQGGPGGPGGQGPNPALLAALAGGGLGGLGGGGLGGAGALPFLAGGLG